MIFNRLNPFLAQVLINTRMNSPHSSKEVWQITICLKNSNIEFLPGDSLGIIPQNSPNLIKAILNETKIKPNQDIIKSFKEKAINFANLKILKYLAKFYPKLNNELNNPSNTKKLLSYSLLKILKIYPYKGSIEDFINNLLPIKPRFYTIANSPLSNKETADILYKIVYYEGKAGTTTGYLKTLSSNKDKLKCFLLKNRIFKLPQDLATPIIMIGPGTGIAPFRAFLQHRYFLKSTYNNNWLFFGEPSSKYDFIYFDELKKYQNNKLLKLTTAFSRDTKQKYYVQDAIKANAPEIKKWLIEDKASLYICGDAKNMEPSCYKTLKEIIGNNYFNQLKKNRKILSDTY